MIRIEVNGIPALFNEAVLNDYELLEATIAMSKGDVTEFPSVALKLFGEEQLANIKESLRGDDGIVQFTDMQEFVLQAFDAAAKEKKAEPKN